MSALSEWILPGAALIPMFFAARVGKLIDRAAGLVAMQVALAAWLVIATLLHKSQGSDALVADIGAVVFTTSLWIGARQWSGLQKDRWIPVLVATGLVVVVGASPIATDWLMRDWEVGPLVWSAIAAWSVLLYAVAVAPVAIGHFAKGGLFGNRHLRMLLTLACVGPGVLTAAYCAQAGSNVPRLHPASFLPLACILGWMIASRESASSVAEAAEPILLVDEKGRIADGNRAAFTLLGAVGRNPETLNRLAYTIPALRRMLEDPNRASDEFFLGPPASRSCHEVRELNAPSEIGHRVLTVRDVTTRRESERVLLHQANFDSLTGLANRRFFLERLATAISEAEVEGSPMAVMYIDLDRFKAVNDTYGHAAGDELLRIIGHRLRQQLRERSSKESDGRLAAPTLARLGGDEFALLLPGVGEEADATEVAVRMLELIAEPVMLEGRKLWNSGSVGVSLYPEHGRDVQALMRAADVALYHAKAKTSHGHQVFRNELTEASRRKAALDQQLRGAIQSGEFELYFQPKVSVEDSSISGAEGLLRWDNAELGKVSPAEFIPVAEEFGLIGSIGTWVIESTCEKLDRWHSEGIPIVPVSINVSPEQFKEAPLTEVITDALRKYDVRPEWLEVELTESTLLEKDEATVQSLRELRSIGVRVSLDDFGSGYSSLSYLNRVPLDVIKLDRNFIRDIHQDPGAEGVVAAVITMGHALDLKVVAEGVDCAEQCAVLSRLGCDLIQGFVFSPAVTEDEFREMLRSQTTLRVIDESMPEQPVVREPVEQQPVESGAVAASDPVEAGEAGAASNALVVDDGAGRLGPLAMRMNRMGATTFYAMDFDEAVLFVGEEGASIKCIVVPVDAPSERLVPLWTRIAAMTESAPAAVFVGEGDPNLKLSDSDEACQIWAIREPVSDAQLRHVLKAALSTPSPPIVERKRPRAPCDMMASVVVGEAESPVLLSSLSDQGAFIELKSLPNVGAIIDLQFEVEDEVVGTPVRVLYQTLDSDREEPSGVGVLFLGLDADSRDRIGRYVDEHAVRCLT